MLTDDYVPSRGEIIWINFNPQTGHEHAGRRPAVVLSPTEYNRKVGLLLLCPITSKKKGYPFEVELPEGLPLSGVALADQIKSLDWRARKAEYACSLTPDLLEAILTRSRVLLA
jgi:mRNA interferase MazF